MKFLFLVFILVSCSTLDLNFNPESDKTKLSYPNTSSIPIPNQTSPYSVNLCKAKDYIPAYSFVVKGTEFDKKGCVKPLEAWIYDSEISRWVYVDPNLVNCCNPLKGYKKLTY